MNKRYLSSKEKKILYPYCLLIRFFYLILQTEMDIQHQKHKKLK